MQTVFERLGAQGLDIGDDSLPFFEGEDELMFSQLQVDSTNAVALVQALTLLGSKDFGLNGMAIKKRESLDLISQMSALRTEQQQAMRVFRLKYLRLRMMELMRRCDRYLKGEEMDVRLVVRETIGSTTVAKREDQMADSVRKSDARLAVERGRVAARIALGLPSASPAAVADAVSPAEEVRRVLEQARLEESPAATRPKPHDIASLVCVVSRVCMP